MKCSSQESLYVAFIMVILAGTMIYWYTSPTYGPYGTTPPQTMRDKVQYWGSLILLTVVGIIVFVAATNSASSSCMSALDKAKMDNPAILFQ